jgi:hypothetical protein
MRVLTWAESLRHHRHSSHLHWNVATLRGIDDGIRPCMTNEDLFEDGGGKNARTILRLHCLTLAPQHLKSLTIPLPNDTLSFVDSHGNDPLTVLSLISLTEACNRFRHLKRTSVVAPLSSNRLAWP